jgi:hypothetical protein
MIGKLCVAYIKDSYVEMFLIALKVKKYLCMFQTPAHITHIELHQAMLFCIAMEALKLDTLPLVSSYTH